MAYTTVYAGIVFIEGPHPDASIICDITCDLSFKFGAQLKNLNDVKNNLVAKAKAHNANCVTDFKYGQKSRWLAIDDVAFWGSGKCAFLPENVYAQLVEKHSIK
ncbi:MAG: hypothetical protein PHO15_00925 [Eubacteriales bacterium]|nr:hypothetical protein [Eubacteriales bacterium]